MIMGVLAIAIPWVQENITPDMLTYAFAGVNMLLRLITKDKLEIS